MSSLFLGGPAEGSRAQRSPDVRYPAKDSPDMTVSFFINPIFYCLIPSAFFSDKPEPPIAGLRDDGCGRGPLFHETPDLRSPPLSVKFLTGCDL